MKQPNFEDKAAYKYWIKNHYPAQVAETKRLCGMSIPRDEYSDNHVKELIQRKREIARLTFEQACKLMRDADDLERSV